MTMNTAGTPLPASVSSHMAWEAFETVFSKTNFRLQMAAFDPISLFVEHDHTFGKCLTAGAAWESTEKAKGWVANRVLELASAIDKTSVRSVCLQVPRAGDQLAIEAFLVGLQRRMKDDIRNEIAAHYDTSIDQWEDDALAFVMSDGDALVRSQLYRYTGLDQRLSVEAARKALKWIHSRCHWWLEGTGKNLILKPNYQFDIVKSERNSKDETARARSLAARCVEVIVNEGVRRAVVDRVFAPVTRASIKADLNSIFQKDGPWGLVHLTLVTDRRRYCIMPPPWQNLVCNELVERQDPYLFEPRLA